jgi:hypothetical protein
VPSTEAATYQLIILRRWSCLPACLSVTARRSIFISLTGQHSSLRREIFLTENFVDLGDHAGGYFISR